MYAQRVKNFNEYASSSDAAFLIHVSSKERSYLEQAQGLIKYKYPLSKIILISSDEDFIPSGGDLVINPKKPRPDYQWFMSADFATDEGLEFEMSIYNPLRDFLFSNDGI